MPRKAVIIAEPKRRPAAGDDAKWAAVVARDTAFDGQFVMSVSTTGIYCRPGCPARQPKRVNVAFHKTCADAEAAGFRACKRCKPKEPALMALYAAKVADACRFIETAETEPKLPELSALAGLSPSHFHRIFKTITGVTPKAYATGHRHKRVRDNLGHSETVTEAIFASGFNSNGRFYATSPQTLGMTPTAFRSGGTNTKMVFALAKCSLGCILIAATDKGVSAILLGDDPEAVLRDLQDRFPNAELTGGDKKFNALTAKVVAYVERPQRPFDLPLDVQGTVFQHQVWAALRKIPAGSTASYTDIAKLIGKPASVRAVAAACGANPVAIVIPCHRVVRNDGTLSGYRWGIERKRKLLDLEAKPQKKRD